MTTFVAAPLSFNPLKHHAQFIREFILRTAPDALAVELKKVGHGQIDLYTGSLDAKEIHTEVGSFLRAEELENANAYRKWIAYHRGFHTLVLSDGSRWILRAGTDIERYVHLHPARKSPHSYRLSANTLATAVAVLVCVINGVFGSINTTTINSVRKKVLHLAPVKSDQTGVAIRRALSLLKNQ